MQVGHVRQSSLLVASSGHPSVLVWPAFLIGDKSMRTTAGSMLGEADRTAVPEAALTRQARAGESKPRKASCSQS